MFFSVLRFCSQYNIIFSCHVPLDSSWLWQFFRLCLKALRFLRNAGQIACKMPPTGIFQMFIIFLEGEQRHKVPLPLQRIMLSTWFMTINVDFDHLPGFSTVKLHSPHFPYCACWKKVTMYTLHSRVEYFYNLIRIL